MFENLYDFAEFPNTVLHTCHQPTKNCHKTFLELSERSIVMKVVDEMLINYEI